MPKRGATIYSEKRALIHGIMGLEARQKFGVDETQAKVNWLAARKHGSGRDELALKKKVDAFYLKRWKELKKKKTPELRKIHYG